jgi:uncharacterized protein (DUF169 family)
MPSPLQEALGLRLPPIAVSLVDKVPAGVPARSGPAAAAGCAFWEEAARGPFATVAADHALCAIGIHTHNLTDAPPQQASELGKVLEVLGQMTYVREEDVAKIPVLERAVKHAVYAPLDQAPVDPDVVLLFVDARQSLVVAEAAEQLDPERPPALGRPACALIPQVANTGRAALSLGCCGARAYLDALSDDVALWGIPGARVAEFEERIAALAAANATLETFHTRRREDVAAGKLPTVEESLARLA